MWPLLYKPKKMCIRDRAYPDGILKVPRDEVFYFLSTVLRHEALDIIKDEKDNEPECLVYDAGMEGGLLYTSVILHRRC